MPTYYALLNIDDSAGSMALTAAEAGAIKGSLALTSGNTQAINFISISMPG